MFAESFYLLHSRIVKKYKLVSNIYIYERGGEKVRESNRWIVNIFCDNLLL